MATNVYTDIHNYVFIHTHIHIIRIFYVYVYIGSGEVAQLIECGIGEPRDRGTNPGHSYSI